MKNIKKFLLIMAMTMALGTSAFAASGFEFILNVPLGAGITIVPKDYKGSGFKGTAGFDAGVEVQLGYMFQVVNGFGVSALVELGYAHDHFGFSVEEYDDAGNYTTPKLSYDLDSFKIGLLPKFNIGAFAIGIGGGVKVPLGGKMTYKLDDYKASDKLEMGFASSMFTPPVIGYVKATFDYSVFFTDNLAFNIGLYLGGDIAKFDLTRDANNNDKPAGISNFDVGVELGLKFGPKA